MGKLKTHKPIYFIKKTKRIDIITAYYYNIIERKYTQQAYFMFNVAFSLYNDDDGIP